MSRPITHLQPVSTHTPGPVPDEPDAVVYQRMLAELEDQIASLRRETDATCHLLELSLAELRQALTASHDTRRWI